MRSISSPPEKDGWQIILIGGRISNPYALYFREGKWYEKEYDFTSGGESVDPGELKQNTWLAPVSGGMSWTPGDDNMPRNESFPVKCNGEYFAGYLSNYSSDHWQLYLTNNKGTSTILWPYEGVEYLQSPSTPDELEELRRENERLTSTLKAALDLMDKMNMHKEHTADRVQEVINFIATNHPTI